MMNTYRINPKLFRVLLVFLLLLPVVVTVRAQEGGFQETFDDPTLPGWELSPEVQVVDGVLRVEPDGFAFHGGQWSDLTLSLRARRTEAGFLTIRYSVSDTGAYNFGFGDKGMALLRDESGSGTELANAPVQTPADQWVQVSITVIGGLHTLSLDGQTVLTATDPQPLSPGGIVLQAGGPATGEFDDLVVNANSEISPSPTQTLAGETAGTYQGRLIDAHSHLPAGGGMSFDAVADTMIAQMDQAGVEAALIYGVRADYTGQEDQDILAQARRYPGRLIPFLSGFDPDDPSSVEYVRQQLATGEWAGLGELYIRHSANPEWAVSADNTVLMEIYQLAAQYDVPVVIHFEPDFQTDRASGEAELERALQANPTTTFVLLHYSFNFATPERLAAFPNLYLVFDAIPEEQGLLFVPNELDSTVNGRVGVGTDMAATEMLQDTSSWSYTAMLNGIRQALGQLPLEQAETMAYQTILELVKIEAPAAVAEPTLSPVTPQQTASVPTGVPAYQAGSWARTGGPIGGLGYDIRYNFADTNIWYVTDAWSGFYISTDNGSTWTQSNTGITSRRGIDGIPVFSATVDPHNPNIIWIGTDGTADIYKSTDGGYTWVEMTNGVDPNLIPMSFRGFTVDPRTSDIVYAMAEIGSPAWTPDHKSRPSLEDLDMTQGIVYKTTDGGQTWTEIWRGDNLARYCWIDPRNPDVLYVSTGIFDRHAANSNVETGFAGGVGILKSTDGGQTWHVLNQDNGLLDLYIGSLYMNPQNPDMLLAAAGQGSWSRYGGQQSTSGIYLTEDGGEHWDRVIADDELFSAVEYCVSDPNVAYAGSSRSIYRSDDGGHTWQQFTRANHTWGSPGVVAGFPIDMQCDPVDPMRIFINNYLGGNFLSTDGGQTWILSSGGYTGEQVDVVVAVSGIVYVGSRSGVFRSDNGGEDWNGLVNPPDGTSIKMNEVLTLAVDPADSNHLLAVFKDWDGVVYSTDGGQSWQMGSTFGSKRLVFALSDPSIVYAAADSGLFVSRDGGMSWTPIQHEQVSGFTPSVVAVQPSDANTVYVSRPDTGVLKTTDGGQTWTLLTTGLPQAPVKALAVDPANPQILFAGTGAGQTSMGGTGVFRSMDGGLTWTQLSAGLPPEGMFLSVVIDPTNSQIVYVGDNFSGVYVSIDGGNTWNTLNNELQHREVRTLSISPDGRVLYAGTWGDGVYRLGTP